MGNYNFEEERVEEFKEKLYLASQWQLIWWKFKKHKLAVTGLIIILILYILAIFCGFFAPYYPTTVFDEYTSAPPQIVRIYSRDGGLQRPFVYRYKKERDPVTLRLRYVINYSEKCPVRFFVKGKPYKLLGLFDTDIHLFGVDDGTIFLFGTDDMGRDIFSRVLYGARISLSIGLVGVFISFLFGMIIGGISGYFGGAIDNFVQRTIDFLISIPTLPLWMALAAALPREWSIIKTYFAITIILSLVGWCGLARVVRGKLLALREEEFTLAARLAGASEFRIITRHLLPSFASYLIVSITLSIPNMILGETALSFLGLGMQEPAVSWGVLLQRVQNLTIVAHQPWQLIPCIFVIVTVLSFNFLGDGLRDAADPYAR
jgi:peptide/nickel transport system permease protein